MSADRPYQSHLFNSLNRSVQRAKDKAGLLWRTFKVNLKGVALWSARMSLYPVYAVLNASRQVGQTFRTIGRLTQVPLADSAASMPESDAPVLNVLNALVTRQIVTVPVGQADCLTIVLAQGTQIQGFASVLSTRRLTIVTTTSEILDILSERQENELRQRIIYEIAIYWKLMRSRISPTSGRPIASVQIPTLWNNSRSSLNSGDSGDLGSQRDWSDLIQAAWHYFFGGLFGGGFLDGRSPALFWKRSVSVIPSVEAMPVPTPQINPDPWMLNSSIAPTTEPGARRWSISSRLVGSFSGSIVPVPPPVIPVLTANPSEGLSASSQPSRAATHRRAPEWLEVSATSLGYEVSWLDRLVLGLDRAIVFLEQIFLTFWTWLQVLRKS